MHVMLSLVWANPTEYTTLLASSHPRICVCLFNSPIVRKQLLPILCVLRSSRFCVEALHLHSTQVFNAACVLYGRDAQGRQQVALLRLPERPQELLALDKPSKGVVLERVSLPEWATCVAAGMEPSAFLLQMCRLQPNSWGIILNHLTVVGCFVFGCLVGGPFVAEQGRSTTRRAGHCPCHVLASALPAWIATPHPFGDALCAKKTRRRQSGLPLVHRAAAALLPHPPRATLRPVSAHRTPHPRGGPLHPLRRPAASQATCSGPAR